MKMNQRQQHKNQIRRLILDVASEIIVKEGIERLTIRKIASAIDYSIPTVYEYFTNKEALLKELQREWLKKMQEIVQQIYAKEEDPRAALRKISETYFAFAQERPAFYRAVMGMDSGCMDDNKDFPEIYTLRAILKDVIQNILQDKKLSQNELEDRVDLFRCRLHGIVSLMLVNKIKGGAQRARVLLDRDIASFTNE
jgi:AcrR family transcriptional regulator